MTFLSSSGIGRGAIVVAMGCLLKKLWASQAASTFGFLVAGLTKVEA
jgi:hypothetical protein